jgi:hypothetical protein
MVGDERVAFVNLGRSVMLEHAAGAGGKRTHVERENDVLRHDFPSSAQDRAACVLRFADDRRVAGTEEGVLHLLDDAGQAGLDHLQCNRVNGHIKQC